MNYKIKEDGEIIQNKDLPSLKKYALFLLGKRDYSQKKIIEKLSKKTTKKEDITQIIEWLLEYNYLNDERYAANLIRKYEKKEGVLKINNRLKIDGISVDIINNINSDDVGEDIVNHEILLKKYKKYEKIDETKYWGYLGRRGFKTETIKKLIKLFMENTM